MRNRSKTFFKLLLIASLLAAPFLGVEAQAQKQKQITVQNENVRDDNLDDMSFVEMINSVEIDGKSADASSRIRKDATGCTIVNTTPITAARSRPTETKRSCW